MNYDRPELRSRLAAEYVLGTLAGGARRRFEALLRNDHAAQEAVAFWQRELTPMAAPLKVKPPPPRVWEAIAARVQPKPAASAREPGWFERWFGVRGLGAVGALAAGLVIGVGLVPMLHLQQRVDDEVPEKMPAAYTGILAAADGKPSMLVNSPRHGRYAEIKVLRPVAAEATQELRLWALPANGTPFALGIVPATGKARLAIPDTAERLLSQVTELAVSIEAKGSAVPAPSGPFVLRGPCAKFW